jgi:G:T-mismatch repair DNA endonuclease (very short patch repair protein)
MTAVWSCLGYTFFGSTKLVRKPARRVLLIRGCFWYRYESWRAWHIAIELIHVVQNKYL